MLTRRFALILGILFSAAAVGGFIPLITPSAEPAHPLIMPHAYGHLLGLFPVNVVHNMVHGLIGIGGLVAWRSEGAARLYARVVAVVLGAFTILGLIPALSTLGGMMPVYGHAIWLHGLEAVIAAYIGYLHPLRVGQVHDSSAN